MLTTIMPTHRSRSFSGRQTHKRALPNGFTLVELLIALLLGALVIGGVATVFISSQQTYVRLTQYNNAQEAFRYASHAITRITRGAEAVEPSGANSLVLRLGPVEGGTNRNCVGALVTATEFNRFSLTGDNELICEISLDNGATWGDGGTVLVRNVDTFNVTYDDTGGFDTYIKDYRQAGVIASDAWGNVNGIRVTIGMVEGYSVEFTASVRARLLPAEVVVRPSG